MRSGYPSAYYPPKYKAFKKDVSSYLKEHFSHIRFECEAVYLTYTFIFNRPKALQRKKDTEKRIKHIKKPDLDNLIKSINDVLEDAGILSNDSIVQSIKASKFIAGKDEAAHIIIELNHG